MGEVIVDVVIENAFDAHLARTGQLADGNIRRRSTQALVDTGATELMLPEQMVEDLGLDLVSSTIVEYADGRLPDRPIATFASLTVLGRTRTFDCVVGERGTLPLIGQVVLESLDLLVDCKRQRLLPRPESPDLPLHRA